LPGSRTERTLTTAYARVQKIIFLHAPGVESGDRVTRIDLLSFNNRPAMEASPVTQKPARQIDAGSLLFLSAQRK
jgi:hypothetical protein